ncbi:O-linked N-acetylglucosamine transferase, SPINDLY family protein [Synechococcales cyanobacterium C]|uniref:O-linked N-acetylglucosamine transferase, SPINDLY family protein n=1 Tax=Petrachloros mirabilis ULC683 TaxID=2781853 RepID=A0A8K2A957_9CYAN|nr:O-linked N-acetylglucosamine transferase, SPINDLY family protein [Petrachloros mirabilis]NCJ08766.1 O-linked N-acetylglucosamine transferase, SPINDLY family protein [Petrachloros mirabilis ULC683]
MDIRQIATQYLEAKQYQQLVALHENAIEAEPKNSEYYWYLGLAYLLLEQEESAQITWLMGMSQVPDDQVAEAEQQLFDILCAEAERQEALEAYELAWAIRHHAQQVSPQNLDNILRLLWLAANHLNIFTLEDLQEHQLVDRLNSSEEKLDSKLLLKFIKWILEEFEFNPELLELLKASAPPVTPDEDYIDTLTLSACKLSSFKGNKVAAIQILSLCLEVDPNHLQVLATLAQNYEDIGKHFEAIELGEKCLNLSQNLLEKIHARRLLLRLLMGTGGHWHQATKILEQYLELLNQLGQMEAEDLATQPFEFTARSCNIPYWLPYCQDNLSENRDAQNRIAALCYYAAQKDKVKRNLNFIHPEAVQNQPIRLGFVAHTLRQHSVGWLARWFFQYYDLKKFQIYLYFHASEPDEFTRKWFTSRSFHGWSSTNPALIAEQVNKDQIDILVDLDSLTLDSTCEIMAWKPAPIQATWLGWDASGLPSIDYFIADPYVLPEDADQHYCEKIWRMPQTYIAVDGFEIGTPTRRRDHLDIPGDAIVYLSAQAGWKRHPDTIRLQLKILKEVKNSYLLIKGRTDAQFIKEFTYTLAEEEGVSPEQLRFLGSDASEYSHRANWRIADVVLDTYPYNGATTTLETLWMEVPVVTKVGQQFAARNSYGFLVNVGVTEGIAWTDEEYVEWGIRLGTDPALRRKVSLKLRASKHNSPLWNSKKFAQDMENAFEEMVQIYNRS